MIPQYVENGSIYVFRPRMLRETGNRLGGRIALYEMGEDAAIEIDSEHDFKNFYRGLRLAFDGRTLCLPVKDFENTIAYGLRRAPPPRDMTEYLERAVKMSQRYEIDFASILSVIYNTNPVGTGVL